MLAKLAPVLRRVLVVDPNPHAARLLTEIIKGMGAAEIVVELYEQLCEDDLIQAPDLRLADASGAAESGEASLAQIDNLEDYLEEIERKLIMQALEETRWNRTAAAQRLGLTFRSMRYRLKKLGID